MPPIKVGPLGEFLRTQRKSAQLSLRQLAEQAGVSNPYLSQIERGLRRPSAEILQQIAKGLRISAEQLYVQAGILEERTEGELAVESALLADPALTERQKRMLLEIYRSFRAENVHGDAVQTSGDHVDDDPVGEHVSATPPTPSPSTSTTKPAAGAGRSKPASKPKRKTATTTRGDT